MGHSKRSEIGTVHRVPGYGRAVAASDKVGYVLSPEKSNGKWRFFKALGYTEANPEELQRDLLEGLKNNGGKEFITTKTGEHVFEVVMELGISSKAKVRTAWQIDNGSDIPRFITGYKFRPKKGEEKDGTV